MTFFFLTKRTGAQQGEQKGLINPIFRFSFMNSHNVCSSSEERKYIGLSRGLLPSSICIEWSVSR